MLQAEGGGGSLSHLIIEINRFFQLIYCEMHIKMT